MTAIRRLSPTLARLILIMALLVIPALVWMSCSRADKSAGQPAIAVTNGAQRWLLTQIAGDSISVTDLLPPGTDPETFDPDISSMVALQNCAAYLTAATPGFEQRITEIVGANFKDVKVINVAEGITPISGTHRVAGSHDPHQADPHILGSVSNARIMAANMLEAVCAIDPANAGYYTGRHRRLEARLDSLDSSIRSSLREAASRREGSLSFIVMHPSLSYFARDYGLTQFPLETDGKEASPAGLRDALSSAMLSSPSVFLIEKGHGEEQARQLAAFAGVPAETFTIDDYGWFDNMRHISKAISATGLPTKTAEP